MSDAIREAPKPKERKPKTPPIIMRCAKCRLLCLSGAKSQKTYRHGAWNGKAGKVDTCPGSNRKALHPKGTRLRLL